MGTAVTMELCLLAPATVRCMVLLNGLHGKVFHTAFQVTEFLHYPLHNPQPFPDCLIIPLSSKHALLILCWLFDFRSASGAISLRRRLCGRAGRATPQESLHFGIRAKVWLSMRAQIVFALSICTNSLFAEFCGLYFAPDSFDLFSLALSSTFFVSRDFSTRLT